MDRLGTSSAVRRSLLEGVGGDGVPRIDGDNGTRPQQWTSMGSSMCVQGSRLPAGSCAERLADEDIQSSGRWVESVGDGTVAGRALAVVILE